MNNNKYATTPRAAAQNKLDIDVVSRGRIDRISVDEDDCKYRLDTAGSETSRIILESCIAVSKIKQVVPRKHGEDEETAIKPIQTYRLRESLCSVAGWFSRHFLILSSDADSESERFCWAINKQNSVTVTVTG